MILEKRTATSDTHVINVCDPVAFVRIIAMRVAGEVFFVLDLPLCDLEVQSVVAK